MTICDWFAWDSVFLPLWRDGIVDRTLGCYVLLIFICNDYIFFIEEGFSTDIQLILNMRTETKHIDNTKRLINLDFELWRAINTVILKSNFFPDTRIMVIGEKNVGKSTFVQYLLNCFLTELERKKQHPLDQLNSSQKTNEQNHDKQDHEKQNRDNTVCCLDLDPGQPLQSTPGVLSLRAHKSPLVGPAYTYSLSTVKSKRELAHDSKLLAARKKMIQQLKRLHGGKNVSKCKKSVKRIGIKEEKGTKMLSDPAYRTLLEKLEDLKYEDIYCNPDDGLEYLLGNVSSNTCYVKYLRIAQKLMESYTSQHKNKPLIVNTMGWLRELGTSIFAELIKIIKPTHVIHLGTEKDKFRKYSHDDMIKFLNGKNYLPILITLPNTLQYYEYLFIDPRAKNISPHTVPHPSPKPYEIRNLGMLAYFAPLWPQKAESINFTHCKPFVSVDSRKMAFYNLSYGRIILTTSTQINGLYALCQAKSECVVKTSNNLQPKYKQTFLTKEKSEDSVHGKILSPDLFVFKAWALLIGRDEKSHKIRLLTPRGEDCLEGVNIMVKCNVDFPDLLQ